MIPITLDIIFSDGLRWRMLKSILQMGQEISLKYIVKDRFTITRKDGRKIEIFDTMDGWDKVVDFLLEGLGR